MKGQEFITRVKKLAKTRNLCFDLNRKHGKGSHVKLTCGDRVTVVRNSKDELKTGTFKAMLKRPDIDESEFQAMQYTYPVLLSEDK